MNPFEALKKYRQLPAAELTGFIACGKYFSLLDPWERIGALHLAKITPMSLEDASAAVLLDKLIARNFSEIEKRVMAWLCAGSTFSSGAFDGLLQGGLVNKSVDESFSVVHKNEYVGPPDWSNNVVTGMTEAHLKRSDGHALPLLTHLSNANIDDVTEQKES